MTRTQKECQTCGGTGQISFFKGVSRFLLSCEECPDCAGFGFAINDTAPPENGKEQRDDLAASKKNSRRENRKKGQNE